MKKNVFFYFLLFLITGNYISAQTARVQVIHNSPDLAAETVDVYVNGAIPDASLDDFLFRTATPFLTVPAGVALTIDITASDAVDNSNPVFTKQVTLVDGFTYILVADGIVSPTGYDPMVPFDINIYPFGQEAGLNGASNTDVVLHHGGTDTPTEIDVIDATAAPGSPALFNSADYGKFVGRDNSETTNGRYKSLPAADYVIKVTDEATVETIEAYEAPFTNLEGVNLAGDAVVLVASGFMDPAANSDGAPFGLFVFNALGGGGVGLELPPVPKADVQLIHNSPDAGPVDVYVENVLTFEDVNFRTASPFFEAFSKINLKIDLRPADSNPSSLPALSDTFLLDENNDYVIVVDGLLSGSGNTALGYQVYDTARRVADDNTKVDVLVHHGSPDAPAVDVFETAVTSGTEIVDNISFPEFDGYLTLDPLAYELEVRPEGSTDVVGAYDADLSGLTGEAITIIASGLLTPPDASQEFGLYVFRATGGEGISLNNNALSVEEFNKSGIAIWPNPINTTLNVTIPFSFAQGDIDVFDLTGRSVFNKDIKANQSANTINVSKLSTGFYLLRLTLDNKELTTKIQVR